jgi:hypothetical protein
MPDYTICFDVRWIFYPALTVCSFIFGIGLAAILAQIWKHWRSRDTANQVAQQQRLKAPRRRGP